MLKDSFNNDFLGRYSTFTIVEKKLRETVELLLRNERLKRLLYYDDAKALYLPKLTPQQTLSIIEKQISTCPKVPIDLDERPHIILTMNRFSGVNGTDFRNCYLEISILCPYECWNLNDFKIRPYSIAGEIDAMINRSNFTGLGIAKFITASIIMCSPDTGGLVLSYFIDSQKEDVTLHPPEPIDTEIRTIALNIDDKAED